MWKALAGAGAEQNYLATQIAQPLEGTGIKRFEAYDRPKLNLIWGHKHVCCVAHPIDFNKARTVRSYGVLSGGRVGVQLQIARYLESKCRRVEYIIGTLCGTFDV
jgi:hypothetical protein